MIVAAFRNQIGTVYINDEAYRDASPEELRRREENLQRTVWDTAVRLAEQGIEPKWPDDLEPIERLDMNDPEVIREIQEYEATKKRNRQEFLENMGRNKQ